MFAVKFVPVSKLSLLLTTNVDILLKIVP